MKNSHTEKQTNKHTQTHIKHYNLVEIRFFFFSFPLSFFFNKIEFRLIVNVVFTLDLKYKLCNLK